MLFKLFFHVKPAMMLIELKNSKKQVYASTLAKSTDCTYSHVIKMLKEMKDGGLVSFNKTGRLKYVTLTKTGEELAENLNACYNQLK